jgi:adenosylcobinamide-GDP ribazoletransferase
VIKGLLLAIQFLTIIPVRIRGEVGERQVGRSSLFFPLVGVIQGAVVATAVYLLSGAFTHGLLSGTVVLLLIALNGGFHMDGLADTFDAMAVKASGDPVRDREKRLAVMKDSTTGAIGVTAVVMAILLKYLLVASLFERCSTTTTVELLFLLPLFSKWTMVPVMAHGKPARKEGLGKIFVERTGAAETVGATLLAVIVFLASVSLTPTITVAASLAFAAVCGLILYAFAMIWARFCTGRFGGLTGDTAGAAGEMADIIFLVTGFLWFS